MGGVIDACTELYFSENIATIPLIQPPYHKLRKYVLCIILCVSQAGRSRSATVVTAYLMKTHKLGFTEAYQMLKDLKPDVQLSRVYVSVCVQ